MVADEYVEAKCREWRSDRHANQWRLDLGMKCEDPLPIDQVDTVAVLKVLKPLWDVTPESALRRASHGTDL